MTPFLFLFTVTALSVFFLCQGSQIQNQSDEDFEHIAKEKITESLKIMVKQCHSYNKSGPENQISLDRERVVQSLILLVKGITTFSLKMSDIDSMVLLEFLYRSEENAESIRSTMVYLFENMTQDFFLKFIQKLPEFLSLKLHPIPIYPFFAKGDRKMIDTYIIYIERLYQLVFTQLNRETEDFLIFKTLEGIAISIIRTDFPEEMIDTLKPLLFSKNIRYILIKSDFSTDHLVQFLNNPKTKSFLDTKRFLNHFLDEDFIATLSNSKGLSSSHFNCSRIFESLRKLEPESFESSLADLSEASIGTISDMEEYYDKVSVAVQKMNRISIFQSQREGIFSTQNNNNTERLEEIYEILKTVKSYKTDIETLDPDAYNLFSETINEILIHFMTLITNSPAHFRRRNSFLEFKILVLLYDISDYASCGEEQRCIFKIIEMFNITTTFNVMSDLERSEMSFIFGSVFKIIRDTFSSKSDESSYKRNPEKISAVFEFLKNVNSDDKSKIRCYEELTKVYINNHPNIEDVILIWDESVRAELFDPNIFVLIFFVQTQQTPQNSHFLRQFGKFLIDRQAVTSSQRMILNNFLIN